ncbi:protein of unknown function [Methylocaldum szegediense]|uniref:Uncharacterized protein n=1 Tax=Methylocaldum szegediense TaxID=73780 RepID=A0ABN8X0Y8_9GAMM|nr:protein of unknown function [Methylocaldum szegediense]
MKKHSMPCPPRINLDLTEILEPKVAKHMELWSFRLPFPEQHQTANLRVYKCNGASHREKILNFSL